jgi:WD40 repeat protein
MTILCPGCGLPQTEAGTCPACRAATVTIADETQPFPEPTSVTPPAGPTFAPAGYEILGEIGRGGMGVVYKARDLALQRIVALKIIGAGELTSDAQRRRFEAEGRAAARLHHPNVVQVFHVGEHAGLPFVVLEYVEGQSLRDRLQATPLPPADAARLLLDLCAGVRHAHEAGIIHRDLKPANILLTANGVPKVADFGLAKALDTDSGQTQSGMVLGTPSYMPPEQASGRAAEVGPSADIYALGAILYECLTGRPPFKGASVRETLEQVCTREPVAPSALQPGVARDLETICLKCLEKDPARRYASVAALAADLSAYLDGRPISARPVGSVERLRRWVVRNPVVASLATAVVLLLLATTGGAIYAAVRFAAESEKQRGLRKEADNSFDLAMFLADSEKDARLEADARLDDSRNSEGRLFTGLARQRQDQGDASGGLAYAAEALRRDGVHPLRSRLHLLRLAAHLDQVPVVRYTGRLAGPASHIIPSPDGRFLLVQMDGPFVEKPQQLNTHLIDLATERRVDLFSTTQGYRPVFSPDGQRLVFHGRQYDEVWSTVTGEPLTGEPPQDDRTVLHARILEVVTAGDGPLAFLAAHHMTRYLGLRKKWLEGSQGGWSQQAAFSADGQVVSYSYPYCLPREVRTGRPLLPRMGVSEFSTLGREIAIAPTGRYRLTESQTRKGQILLEDTEAGWQQPLPGAPPQGPARGQRQFSSDGSLLATLEGRVVHVWNTATGTRAGPPMEHPEVVVMARFHPTRPYLLTICQADRFRPGARFEEGQPRPTPGPAIAQIWHVPTGKPIGDPLPEKELDSYLAIREGTHDDTGDFEWQFLPDEPAIAVVGLFRLLVWDPSPNARRPAIASIPLPRLEGAVRRMDSQCRYALLAGVPKDVARGEVYLWDLRTPQETPRRYTLELEKPSRATIDAAFNPGGTRLAYCSPREVRVLHLATGEQFSLFPPGGQRIAAPNRRGISGILWLPDNRHLLVLAEDRRTFWIWDVERTAPAPIPGSLLAQSFPADRDSGRVLTRSPEGTRVFTETRKVLHTLPPDPLALAAFSANGQRLLTVGGRPAIRKDMRHWPAVLGSSFQVSDASTGQALFAPVPAASDRPAPILGGPGGEYLATIEDPHHVQLWRSTNDEATALLHVPEGVASIRFTDSRNFLQVRSADGQSRFYAPPAHQRPAGVLQPVTGPLRLTGTGEVFHESVFTAGLALVRVDDTTLAVHDLYEPAPRPQRFRTPEPIRHAALDGAGTHLAIVEESGTVRFFDTITGTPIGKPATVRLPVVEAGFHQDGFQWGFRVVAGHEVACWKHDTGELLWRVETEEPFQRIIDLDSKTLLVVSEKTARVHRKTPKGEAVGPAISLVGPITAARLVGKLLATATGSAVHLWDPETGKQARTPLRHDAPVEGFLLGTVPDPRERIGHQWRLATVAGGRVRVWDTGPAEMVAGPVEVQAPRDRFFFGVWALGRGGNPFAAIRDDAVVIWDFAKLGPDAQPAQRLPLPAAPVHTHVTGSLTQFLALALRNGTCGLLDLKTLQFAIPLTAIEHPIEHLASEGDSRTIVVAGGRQLTWIDGKGAPRKWTVEVGGAIERIDLIGSDRVLVSLRGGGVEAWSGSGTAPGCIGRASGAPLQVVPGGGWKTSLARVVERDGATLRLHDGQSGTLLATLEHADPVASVIRLDPQRFATQTSAGVSRIWSMVTGKALSPPLTVAGSRMGPFAPAPAGMPPTSSLLMAWRDREVIVWDATRAQPVAAPLRCEEDVCQAFFLQGDHLLIAAGKTCRIVSAWQNKDLVPPIDHGEAIRWARVSGGRDPLLVLGSETRLTFWSLLRGTQFTAPLPLTSPPRGLLFLDNSLAILTEKELIVWHVARREITGRCPLPEHLEGFYLPAFHRSVLLVENERRLTRVNLDDLTAGARPVTPGGGLRDAILDADGARVATALASGAIQLWDAATGQRIGTRTLAEKPLLQFSRDGNRILAASPAENVLIEARTGKEIARVRAARDHLPDSTFGSPMATPFVLSADGRAAYQVGFAELLRWDLETGQARWTDFGDEPWKPEEQRRQDARVICPVSERIAVVRRLEGGQAEVRVWDTRAGKWLDFTARTPTLPSRLLFGRDGQRLVIEYPASDGGPWSIAARLCDVDTGQPLQTVFLGVYGRPDERAAVLGPFTPDGLGVVAALDRSIRVLDAVTGDALTPAFPITETPLAVEVVGGGHGLLVGGATQTWRFPLAQSGTATDLLERAELLSGRRVEPTGTLVDVPTARLRELSTRHAGVAVASSDFRRLLIEAHTEALRAIDAEQKQSYPVPQPPWTRRVAHLGALRALTPSVDLTRQYAETLAQLGHFNEALQEITPLARQPDPLEGDALFHAYLLLRTDRTAEALAEFQGLAEREGASFSARTGLALAALFAGRVDLYRKVRPELLDLARNTPDLALRAEACRLALLDEETPRADAEAVLALVQPLESSQGRTELRGLAHYRAGRDAECVLTLTWTIGSSYPERQWTCVVCGLAALRDGQMLPGLAALSAMPDRLKPPPRSASWLTALEYELWNRSLDAAREAVTRRR